MTSQSPQVTGREGVWAVVWVGEPSNPHPAEVSTAHQITLVTKEELRKRMWCVQGKQGVRVRVRTCV